MQSYSEFNTEQMTIRDYQNSYDLSGVSKLLFVNCENEPFLILSRTLFHPQGGGQKSDRGTINGIPVLKVVSNGVSIQHFVESASSFVVGQEVEISVDPAWRLICSRLHTAGHLVAGVIEESCPQLKAVAGHHWPGESRVEFDGDCNVSESNFLSEINLKIAQAISNDLRVKIRCTDEIGRFVKVGTYASVPCGGTHVKATSELGDVKIVSAKNKKGKFRVSYEIAV